MTGSHVNRGFGIFVALLAALCAAAPEARADVNVRALLEQEVVEVGDQARLTVTVEGAVQVDEAPRVPPVQGLRIQRAGQQTNISVVNGRMTRSISFDFVITTQKAGNYTLGPIEVIDGGKSYRSAVQKLQVVQAQVAPRPGAGSSNTGGSPPDESRPDSAEDGAIFVRAIVDDADVFVGEQVTLRFQFYQQINFDVLETRLETPPDTQGFLREEIPPQRNRSVTMGGRRYQMTEIVYGLFPTQTGKLSIGSGVVVCSVRDRSRRRNRDPFRVFGIFNEKRVSLRSTPIEVNVRPLPASRPEDFTGGVGSYRISAKLDRTELAQNEPVTLEVVIEGAGNVAAVGEPEIPEMAGFRSFDPSATSSERTRDQDTLGGRKEFSVVLIPETTGRLTVAPIGLSVFSPKRGRYERLETDSLFVEVGPAALSGGIGVGGEVTRVGWDLRAIRSETSLKPAGSGEPWTEAGFWFLQAIPFAVVGAAFLYRRRREHDLANHSSIRSRKAPAALREALKALESADPAEGYPKLEAAWTAYFQDRHQFSLLGRSRAELETELGAAGVDEAAIRSVVSVLERCDFARFTPQAQSQEGWKETVALAMEAAGLLDGAKRPTSGVLAVVWLLPWLALGSIGVLGSAAFAQDGVDPAEAESQFREGNLAYQAGEYSRAVSLYRGILEAGLESPELFLNLGNAHYRMGEIGWAVHAFESGRRLRPGDPDLVENQELALRGAQDWVSEVESSQFLEMLARLQERIPLSRSVLLLSFTVALTLVFVAFRLTRFEPDRRFDVVTGVLVGAVVLSAGWTGVQVLHRQTRPDGVVVAQELQVRSNPNASATVEFTLHAGTMLKIKRTAPGFVEVRFSDEFQGWAPREGIADL